LRQRTPAVLVALLLLCLVLPFSFPTQAFAQELKVEGKGAVLMDAASGEVLFAQNPDAKWYPASVTKVMTLLLALEAVREGRAGLEDKVVTSEHAAGYGGSQVWLKPKETFTLREMLLAIAVGSANDASVAVAEHLAGSEEAFVEQMNKKARELGATNTHFVNSHGLHDPQHYTTARDMALIARYALEHVPEILTFTSVKEYTFRESPKLVLYNTNKLLWWYPGTLGLKTGTTPEAGRSLVTVADRDGLRLISVVLGVNKPKGHFTESMKLLNYGFARYRWQGYYRSGQKVAEVRVAKGAADRVAALAAGDVGLAVPKDGKAAVEVRLEIPDQVTAPVQAGQPVGAAVIWRDGKEIKRVPLVAAAAVQRASLWQQTGRVFRWLLGGGISGKI